MSLPELTPKQISTLVLLATGSTIEDVVSRHGVDRTMVVHRVYALIRRGLIKELNPGRNPRRYGLTDRGSEFIGGKYVQK